MHLLIFRIGMHLLIFRIGMHLLGLLIWRIRMRVGIYN